MSKTTKKITIVDVTIEYIQPINIMANGKMDPSKTMWRHGGTVYHVDTNIGLSYNIEEVDGHWYVPDWSIAGLSLLEVTQAAYEADLAYETEMLKYQEF